MGNRSSNGVLRIQSVEPFRGVHLTCFVGAKRMRALGWLLFVFLPLSVAVLLALFVVFGMENEAAVTTVQAPTSADAARARLCQAGDQAGG